MYQFAKRSAAGSFVYSITGLAPRGVENTRCNTHWTCSELREHNVESRALQVIGQNWSDKKISLPGGLGARESGLELPRSLGYVVTGSA